MVFWKYLIQEARRRKKERFVSSVCRALSLSELWLMKNTIALFHFIGEIIKLLDRLWNKLLSNITRHNTCLCFYSIWSTMMVPSWYGPLYLQNNLWWWDREKTWSCLMSVTILQSRLYILCSLINYLSFLYHTPYILERCWKHALKKDSSNLIAAGE